MKSENELVPSPGARESMVAAVALYDSTCALLESRLDALLPDESAEPQALHRAMRYAVFSGGKRLRPRLLIAVAAATGKFTSDERELVLQAACAVELIHTASLVHDDLPAFDDAKQRRGRATVHVRFGEPLAILAGDALLSRAFEIMALMHVELAPRTMTILRLMGSAAGSHEGIIGGQSMEEVIPIEDRPSAVAGNDGAPLTFTADFVERYHAMKSAALFRLAAAAGAVVTEQGNLSAWAELGSGLGLAYQLADDLYDTGGPFTASGKPMGRDAILGHPNAALIHGAAETRTKMWALLQKARNLAVKLAPEPFALLALLDQADRYFGATTAHAGTPAQTRS